jgi:hypothetical protein
MNRLGRPPKYKTEEERYAAKQRNWAAAKERNRRFWDPRRWLHMPTAPVVVPPAVLEERERVFSLPPTVDVVLLGDPPIGRRAIDRLHRGN